MVASPFGFFRGSYFLFVADLPPKPFLRAAGPVVGDVHTQNFGSFRSIAGEIVFDINDFDETTESWYEQDVCRLAVSLVLAAADSGHRLGDGVNAAEAATREWIASIDRWRHLTRARFAGAEPAAMERRLLASASERSRAELMQSIAQPSAKGSYVFQRSEEFPPATAAEHAAAVEALPLFLRHCLAPAKARPKHYSFQDACRRVAGNGSLGRPRFALLLGKGQGSGESYSSLRLVEWKQALDSSLDRPRPHGSPRRARAVFEATARFQLHPKRYLGFTRMLGLGMQAREIGANDRRFSHRDLEVSSRFEEAAALYGRTLARCHLLGSLGSTGPREVPLLLHGREDAFVHHVLRFAVSYAAQVVADHSELIRHRAKLEKAWQPRVR